MRIERSVLIQRPVEEVFSLAADPNNDQQWGSLIIDSRRLSEPPIGVGTLYHQSASFLGARFSATMEITAYEQDHVMCYSSTDPIPMRNCRTFESTPSGTQLLFLLEAKLEGRFKLAGSLLSRAAQRQVEADLEALKALLESSGRKDT